MGEFSVRSESDSAVAGTWDEDDEQLDPKRRITLFSAKQLPEVIQKIKEFLSWINILSGRYALNKCIFQGVDILQDCDNYLFTNNPLIQLTKFKGIFHNLLWIMRKLEADHISSATYRSFTFSVKFVLQLGPFPRAP